MDGSEFELGAGFATDPGESADTAGSTVLALQVRNLPYTVHAHTHNRVRVNALDRARCSGKRARPNAARPDRCAHKTSRLRLAFAQSDRRINERRPAVRSIICGRRTV